MSKKYICNGEKYELGGTTGDIIGLPLSFKNMPQSIEVNGDKLFIRNAFHVSLVCIGKIVEKYNIQIPDFVNKVVADFCDFVQDNPIELTCYRDEFRFAQEKEQGSVVVMCDISNLNMFYNSLNKKYNLNIEFPPTHVTLYTLKPGKGVFLIDSSDIKDLTKTIPNPIGVNLD